jgi:hypothetical protein
LLSSPVAPQRRSPWSSRETSASGEGSANDDGTVNIEDLNIVLGAFGTSCD